MWFKLNPINILGEFFIYLIIDNITKYIVIKKKKHLHILICECMFLGFLVGFISFYYYIPYVLICFLLIHIIGTIYSVKGFIGIKQIIEIFQNIITYSYKYFINRIFRCSSSKIVQTNKIPKEYQYNYNLKPTNDIRLQQSSFIQTLPRPGIINLYGTTCSLNALLQSLASLNRFYLSFQRNINLSRFNYDPIVPTFLDLISQLRNDHRTSDYKHWTKLVDTSEFISKLNLIYANLLTENTTTDICELFQCIIDTLNNSLSQESCVYSTNVIEQVQNAKLTTFSLEYLNKLFVETEEQIHNKITLDNLDAQTSNIMQYVDITWLLHHIQFGSTMKHTFSGQILHAHCCNNCSHVHFRTEPFQILTLSINKTNQTLEQIISQLTKIEIVYNQLNFYIFNELNISSTTNILPFAKNHIHHKIKSQKMISNFPDVLCIQLKRFSYDRLSNRRIKLNTSIIIEPEKILDLSHLHYTTWLGLRDLSISYHYRLITICLHLSENSTSSSSSSSINLTKRINEHYVCLYRTDHNQWFISDDERIIEINDINNLCQTSYITENCYLLFYERYL
ncbi:unnamed protein product [Rotaria sp. Silwood1]|nr:unnamed protein product [Rotaria sp. Silwood1]CAF4494669.1 unnamed protein product [Rotaria sp. Silwood1]